MGAQTPPPKFLYPHLAVRPKASHIQPWSNLGGMKLLVPKPLPAQTVSVRPTPGPRFQPLLRHTLHRITLLSPCHPMMAEPWKDFLWVESQE